MLGSSSSFPQKLNSLISFFFKNIGRVSSSNWKIEIIFISSQQNMNCFQVSSSILFPHLLSDLRNLFMLCLVYVQCTVNDMYRSEAGLHCTVHRTAAPVDQPSLPTPPPVSPQSRLPCQERVCINMSVSFPPTDCQEVQ